MAEVEVTAQAIGGPFQGKWVTCLGQAMRVATGPQTPDTLYHLKRFKGSGWLVSIPVWVHESMIDRSGQVTAPRRLLPRYAACALEASALLPRVKVQ